LPSLISRMAPIDAKGTAMGIYSSSQFLGAFLGGALGGWAMGTLGASGVFYGCALVMLLWLALALGMRMPAMRSAHMMHVDGARVVSVEALEQQLLALDGVYEARVVPEEDAVFLRIDKQQFDEQQARALLAQAEDGSEHG
ncbi:MAG: MFS transporter, partial [Zetaproteobacteria bacterium]